MHNISTGGGWPMEVAPVLEKHYTFKFRRELVRRRKAKRLMARKVPPDEVGNVYTLTHNQSVSRKCNRDIPEFNGSSLNRKKYAPKKGEEITARFRTQLEKRVAFFNRREGESYEQTLIRMRLSHPQLFRNRIHVLAPRTRTKIRNKFNALFTAAPRKCTFATLTFLSAVKDKQAVQILNKFLTSCRKRFQHFQYIWVAERQKENHAFPGNIHFHILLNNYLPVAEFNALWVLQQYNDGITGHSRKLDRTITKSEIENLAKDPKAMQGVFNPFAIEKVYTVDALANYLSAYLTSEQDEFMCAVWHSSRGVSKTFTTCASDADTHNSIEDPEINYSVDKKTGEMRTGKIYSFPGKPFFTIGYLLNKKHYRSKLKVMEAINRWILYEGFIPDVPRMTEQEYKHRYLNNKN